MHILDTAGFGKDQHSLKGNKFSATLLLLLLLQALELASTSNRSVGPPETATKPLPSSLRARSTAARKPAIEEFERELARIRAERQSSFKNSIQKGGKSSGKLSSTSVFFIQVGVAMALISIILVCSLVIFHNSASLPVEAATKGNEVKKRFISSLLPLMKLSFN